MNNKEDIYKLIVTLEWYQEALESFVRYGMEKNDTAQVAVLKALELDAGFKAKRAIEMLKQNLNQ